jgi:hypothetical protein
MVDPKDPTGTLPFIEEREILTPPRRIDLQGNLTSRDRMGTGIGTVFKATAKTEMIATGKTDALKGSR